MEEQVAGPGFFVILWSWFLLFLMYVVIGFAIGLGWWFAARLTGSKTAGPDRLFAWLGRMTTKLTTRKKTETTPVSSTTQE